jgi:tetratricopeptide (TPR) repeat protein
LDASHTIRVAALCILLCVPARGEENAYTLRGYDPRIQQGIDLIYNLRFVEAERHFQAVIETEPENPLGYFFHAMVAWWRVLVDLDDESHDEAFYKALQECVDVCDRRLEQDPMDFDAILFKGGAIGFRGRLRGDRGQYLKAARDGLRCLPLLEKSRELEPTNKDILFGQAIYHYFAEVMPKEHRIIRPIMVFLPDGDRELGLQQLDQVAREGIYARTEAAYFLAQIYRMFEKDSRQALPYFDELYTRYPDNALFHRYTARLLVELGHWRRGVALYEKYVDRSLSEQAGYHRHGRIEAEYYLGKYAYFKRRFPDAAGYFVAVDRLVGSSERERDQAYASLANLLLGQLYDLEGRRAQAVLCYERVLELSDYAETHQRAKKYMREPYREGRGQ